MRFSSALLTGLFVSTVLAAPHLAVRQANDDSPDDAVLYSPANGTTIQPGQTFNFTYLADDDDTTQVSIAMIQVIPLPGRYNTTAANGGRLVTAQITVPADIAPGSYVIGVREYDAQDDDGDDDNDGDDDDDDDDTPNRPNNGSRIDYDVNFEGPNDDDDRPFYITVEAANATAA